MVKSRSDLNHLINHLINNRISCSIIIHKYSNNKNELQTNIEETKKYNVEGEKSQNTQNMF